MGPGGRGCGWVERNVVGWSGAGCAAVLVVAALGAGGVVYQSETVWAGQAEQAGKTKPRSEVEALRRENELLKLNLEVVLEKVRAQEKELRELREAAQGARARAMLDVYRMEMTIARKLLGEHADATKQADAARGKEVLSFFSWAFRNGGQMAEQLDYVPMPDKVISAVEQSWKQITGPDGKPVWNGSGS